jgi:hypothetical protein
MGLTPDEGAVQQLASASPDPSVRQSHSCKAPGCCRARSGCRRRRGPGTSPSERCHSSGTRDSAEAGLAAVSLGVERGRASLVPGRGTGFALGDGIGMP